KNPPLASYYLALGTLIVGWSEVALHALFLLPAIATILGIRRLAQQFCSHPALAAFLSLMTPALLVSSTTIMCDILMLAFWVWAVVFWVEGLKADRPTALLTAGLLSALAVLTKYYAIGLVPLLGVYGSLLKRRLGVWTAALGVPLAALFFF